HFVAPTANRSGSPPSSQQLPTLTAANNNWAQGTNATYVAAWDVTVANGMSPILGRVYTKSLAVTTGANGPTAGVNSILYALAYDGARYTVNLNGLDGFTSVFFADTKGPVNTKGTSSIADDTSIYRSLQLVDGYVFGNLPSGFGVKNPFVADNIGSNNITHKLFLNPPAGDLPLDMNVPVGQLVGASPVTAIAQITSPIPVSPASTWLRRTYVAPLPPQNLDFVGIEGTIGQAGTGLGGFFRFNNPNAANNATSYRIKLSFGAPYEDRYIFGNLQLGKNSVFWDGRDGNGTVVPASATFTVDVELYNGEIHFPVIDAERHGGGFIINRVITSTLAADIYWDDRYLYTGNGPFDYSICAAPGNPPGQEYTPPPPLYSGGVQGNTVQCYGSNRERASTNPTAPIVFDSPRASLAGTNSSGGRHRWYQNEDLTNTGANVQGTGFGNKRIINTWTYIPSPPATITGQIAIRETDLQVSKTATNPFPSPGSPFTYTVLVTNTSTFTVTGARLIDQVPSSIAPISWTCDITSVSCNPSSGTTTGITTLLNMAPGSVVTLTIVGTAPAVEP
ncbi:MAG: hypothetical protein CV045_13260, partial [Cyanobacteria bacterium M5B4]